MGRKRKNRDPIDDYKLICQDNDLKHGRSLQLYFERDYYYVKCYNRSGDKTLHDLKYDNEKMARIQYDAILSKNKLVLK